MTPRKANILVIKSDFSFQPSVRMVNRAELLSVTKSILHNMGISQPSGPGDTQRIIIQRT